MYPRTAGAGGPAMSLAMLSVLTLALTILGCLAATPALAKARIKDIASFSGARSNPLVGYGLVVGLSGTGDQKLPITPQAATTMLKNLGVNVPSGAVKLKNVASVLVTASLLPFARQGTGIDVTVSSIGDASSLQGGLLVMTPLSAANGEVYAVAQGNVILGTGETASKTSQKTAGHIPAGAIVEKDVPVTLVDPKTNTVDILLASPDFATASSMSRVINAKYGQGVSQAVTAGTVQVNVQAAWTDLVGVLSDIGALEVDVDSAAKIVVSERTGAVVLGANVRILPVSIAYGDLTVAVAAAPSATAPAGSSGSAAQATTSATGSSDEHFATLKTESTVADLVRALDALGASPKDVVGILVTLKEAGAVLADLETI